MWSSDGKGTWEIKSESTLETLSIEQSNFLKIFYDCRKNKKRFRQLDNILRFKSFKPNFIYQSDTNMYVDFERLLKWIVQIKGFPYIL